jgi:beta-glucosidase
VWLADVRYAPVATKLRNATKCRDGPEPDIRRAYGQGHLRSELRHRSIRPSAQDAHIGYSLWRLADNFEWGDGFEQRFGLYHVDFDTKRRMPKLSASFYRETIARNAVA